MNSEIMVGQITKTSIDTVRTLAAVRNEMEAI